LLFFARWTSSIGWERGEQLLAEGRKDERAISPKAPDSIGLL
jgi:hypothetical protein